MEWRECKQDQNRKLRNGNGRKNGTEMERKWNGNGTEMERKWNRNGTERERNGTGTRTEREINKKSDLKEVSIFLYKI